jgi:hypothetical protein
MRLPSLHAGKNALGPWPARASVYNRGNQTPPYPFPSQTNNPEDRPMQLPADGYPISAEVLREWFRRTYGREANDIEIGELQDAMARRDESKPEAAPPR